MPLYDRARFSGNSQTFVRLGFVGSCHPVMLVCRIARHEADGRISGRPPGGWNETRRLAGIPCRASHGRAFAL